jgi:hypothetical protein
MTSPALFKVITVRCFTCPHVERGLSPQEAHDQMETHYAMKYGALIARPRGDVPAAGLLG